MGMYKTRLFNIKQGILYLVFIFILLEGCLSSNQVIKEPAVEELGVAVYPNAEYSAETSDFYFDEDEHEVCAVYYTNDPPIKVVSFYEEKTKIVTDYLDFINKKARPVSTDVETGWSIPFEGKEYTFKNGNKVFITSLEVTVVSPFSKKIGEITERKYKDYKTQIIIKKRKKEYVEENLIELKEFDE